jgi:uncharacterized protein
LTAAGILRCAAAVSTPVCARCPLVLGASCCQTSQEERLALLTWADVRRIGAHLRHPASRFIETDWIGEAQARAYEDRRPLLRGYFRQGPQRLTLRRVASDAPGHRQCVFLEAARGCTLPDEVKPLGCRLYPFDMVPDGRWSLQVGRYGDPEAAKAAPDACLAVEESGGLGSVLRAFQTTRSEIEALGAQLAREVAEHARLSATGEAS